MYSRIVEKMRRTIYIFLMLSVLLVQYGCTEQMEFPSEQREGMVSMSLVPEAMTATKVVPDDMNEGTVSGYQIADFWMFEYDDKGKITGSPRYFEMGSDDNQHDIPVPVILPPAGYTYKCIIIANTHDENFAAGLSDYSTLAAMQKEYAEVSSYSDLYQENGDFHDLMMNGSVDITSTSAEISCSLYRNVARLDVSLLNGSSSDIILNSVQLRSVSDHLFYFDQAYAANQVPSPTESQSGFGNLPIIQIASGGSGTTHDFTFYLPRNLRGTNISLDEEGKNVDAPNHATYLEVMATYADTRSPLRYRFYIGKNMVNDFNVVPNHHYSLSINFSNSGNQYTDSRIEDLGTIFLAESNSYMIHPLSIDAQALYAIPLSRINKFWKSDAGKENPDYLDYTLDSSTQWEAEVIWQDCNRRVINFCSAEGEYENGNTSYTGQGPGYLYFKPTRSAYDNPCNVIIGVKRKGASASDGYMWSWHLWMTDYDPDEDVGGWVDGKYIYPVEGGEVHRYAGTYWINNYYNKYMMDRNLGARSASREDGLVNNAGFSTQFGRKDALPMSSAYKMYDIEGNDLGDCIVKEVGPVPMYKGVMYPTTFYKMAGTDVSQMGDWVKDNAYEATMWNDISGGADPKSIFDPCPTGWRLPSGQVWQNFKIGGKINAVPDSWDGVTDGWDLYIGEAGYSETAFFPSAGWRGLNSGNIEFQNASEYWSYESKNVKTGVNLYMREMLDANFAIPSYNFKSYGMSIRCIRE